MELFGLAMRHTLPNLSKKKILLHWYSYSVDGSTLIADLIYSTPPIIATTQTQSSLLLLRSSTGHINLQSNRAKEPTPPSLSVAQCNLTVAHRTAPHHTSTVLSPTIPNPSQQGFPTPKKQIRLSKHPAHTPPSPPSWCRHESNLAPGRSSPRHA